MRGLVQKLRNLFSAARPIPGKTEPIPPIEESDKCAKDMNSWEIERFVRWRRWAGKQSLSMWCGINAYRNFTDRMAPEQVEELRRRLQEERRLEQGGAK